MGDHPQGPEPPPPDEKKAGPPPEGHEPLSPDLELRERKRGRLPGGRYIRIVRQRRKEFRRKGKAHLVATEQVLRPEGRLGRLLSRVKRTLIGPPLPSEALPHERLTKVQALAVLSSDALSSSAYATEEILLILVLAGTGALRFTLPISFAIAALLAIVALSYRQTIQAYPQGGGSYIVAKDNLGTVPALGAGSALLIDYTLTVAVSISAGVAAITSAIQSLQPYRVELAVFFILFITIANLRGVRESGKIFAAPTYLFIAGIIVMLIVAVVRLGLGTLHPAAAQQTTGVALTSVSAFLLLRAFSSGCAALTGVEAISDGVPAFKEPQARNARITLAWMAILLGVLFLGISFLAQRLHVVPVPTETVVSHIARLTFGRNAAWYFIQGVTMLILVLAANTSFSDFPRLSYFLARDQFLPRYFSFRGDRLAFSVGIMELATFAGALVIIFRAEVNALIPLYAVGVFISFTISQASMVKRHLRLRQPGWRGGTVINAAGAVTTGAVAGIVATTKFLGGAWIVLVLIPVMITLMLAIRHHYRRTSDQLTLSTPTEPLPVPREPTVVVITWGLDQMTYRAVAFARSISRDIRAIFVTDDAAEAEALRRKWERWHSGIPLVILESPFRALVPPVLAYIDAMRAHDPEAPITVVLPGLIPRHWWEWLLHSPTTLRLRNALHQRRNVVVVFVPYHGEE